MPRKTTLIIGALVLIIIILLGLGWYIFFTQRPTQHVSTTATSTATTAPAPIISTNSPPRHIIEQGQYYSIDLEYPSATPLTQTLSAAADADAVALLKADAEQNAASFIADTGVASITPTQAEDIGLNKYNTYSLTSTYDTYTSRTSVSYVSTISQDTLGAHPNEGFDTITFSLKTGKELSLSSLFTPGSTYLNQLSSISRTMLAAQQGASADATDFIDPGTTPIAANFQNFALDGSYLDIFFSPYQVAPYSLGPQIVKIPLSELKDLAI